MCLRGLNEFIITRARKRRSGGATAVCWLKAERGAEVRSATKSIRHGGRTHYIRIVETSCRTHSGGEGAGNGNIQLRWSRRALRSIVNRLQRYTSGVLLEKKTSCVCGPARREKENKDIVWSYSPRVEGMGTKGGLLSRLSSLITLSGIAQRLRKNAALSVTHHVRCKQRWGTRRREWVQRGRIRRRSCPHSGSELQCNFSVITERKSMGGTRGEGEGKGRTQRVGGRHAPQIQILIFPRSVG